jgi:hypothetical protein
LNIPPLGRCGARQKEREKTNTKFGGNEHFRVHSDKKVEMWRFLVRELNGPSKAAIP